MSRPLRRRRNRDSKHISIIVVQKRQVQQQVALLRKEEGTTVQNYEMLKQSLEGEMHANNNDLDEQQNKKSEAEEQKSTDKGLRTLKLQRLSAARASVLSSFKKRRKACENALKMVAKLTVKNFNRGKFVDWSQLLFFAKRLDASAAAAMKDVIFAAHASDAAVAAVERPFSEAQRDLERNSLDKMARLDDRIASLAGLRSTGDDDDDDGYDDGYDNEGRCRHLKLSSEVEPRFVENAARLAAKVRHKATYRKNRDERRRESVGENAMPATSVHRETRLQGTHVLGPEGWVMNDRRDSECLHMYF